MKLIAQSSELEAALKRLPSLLQNKNAEWSSFVDLDFKLHCDLIYFDVIEFLMIAKLPAILSATDESKCFIFNFERLNEDASGPAIEIAATSDENDISRKLNAAAQDKEEDFLSSFYLVPRFGIVSESADWLVLAECDWKAVLLSSHEVKYSAFNALWWSHVFTRMGSTG